MLTKTIRESKGGSNEYGTGLGYIHEMDDVKLQTNAINPSIWYVGDREKDAILLAFEKLDPVNGNHIVITQYSNLAFFRMNIYQEMLTVPMSEDSVSDGNPTITSVKFTGNIRSSYIEMIYTSVNSTGI